VSNDHGVTLRLHVLRRSGKSGADFVENSRHPLERYPQPDERPSRKPPARAACAIKNQSRGGQIASLPRSAKDMTPSVPIIANTIN
jgi:hypothetical protein